MSEDVDKDALEEMVSLLEIKVDNVYHLMLSNGSEMIGELFPPDQLPERESFTDLLSEDCDDIEPYEGLLIEEDYNSSDLLFLNPIKIFRDTFQDETGEFHHQNFFLEWNPCIDGPYTTITKTAVVSCNKPNDATRLEYLKTIYKLYYSVLDEIPQTKIATNLKLKPVITSNVIDFKLYHLNRLNGGF